MGKLSYTTEQVDSILKKAAELSIDGELNAESANPISNQAVAKEFQSIGDDLSKKANISDVFEETSFGWTDFEYTWTSDTDLEPQYTDTEIGGISTYVIHCAGQTLGFDFNNSNVQEWLNNYIIINGIEYREVSVSIPLTYMETDIVVNCDMTTYTFSNMVKKSLKGLPEAITIDSELSETSENPVQNKIVTKELKDVNTNLEEKTSVTLNSEGVSTFGWTEFEFEYSDEYGASNVYVSDSEISISGWGGNIIIHCAGQTLGFTYSVRGWSSTSITINGETFSYIPLDDGSGNTFTENIIIPLTYMKNDIIISDDGMNTWTFTDMQKQNTETVLVKDAVRELNNTVSNLEDMVTSNIQSISELETQIGDIDTALDSILAIQDSFVPTASLMPDGEPTPVTE